MTTKRFAVGQAVRLIGKHSPKTANPYVVTQTMPYDGECFVYRIKSKEEQFMRVAKEYELGEEASSDPSLD